MKKPLLSISLLVSNRMETIRKCLESIKPLLEAVPSELIVVDTVGEENSDGSLEVAKEYTNHIVHFTWCNDFAAARNAGLKQARGEWFLTLDDDEWFDDVSELIQFFQSDEWTKYNSGYYYIRNYQASGNYSMSVMGRMIRLKDDTCYVGKVHEAFNNVYPPHKEFSCFVHHYGYAFSDQASAKKHQERNLLILKEEILQKGGTPRLCAQMTQELLHIEDTRDASYRFAMDALQRNMGNWEWFQDPCAQWILGATVRYYNYKKDYKNAKLQYEWLKTNFMISEMARLVIEGTMTNLAAGVQDFAVIFYHAKEYLKVFDWQQNHKEEALIQTNLDMPKYKGDKYYARIVHLAVEAAKYLGKSKEAEELRKRLLLEGGEGMLVTIIRNHMAKNNYAELLAQAENLVNSYKLSPVAQMALSGVVIEASAPQGNVHVILGYAPIYKDAWKWLKQHQEEAMLQALPEFSKYITRDYAVQIFQVAATCANVVKDYVTAYGYWEMLPWGDKNFDGSLYLNGMQETLAGLEEIC